MKRKILNRILSIFVLIIFLGGETPVFMKTAYAQEEENNKTEQQLEEGKITITQGINKFFSFETEEEQGEILQTKVTIAFNEPSIEIEKSMMTVKVPIIQDKIPDEVIVRSNKREIVSEEKFTEENYLYNKEEGILKIVTNKASDNNKVTIQERVEDEYSITCVYKEKIEIQKEEIKQEVVVRLQNEEKEEISGEKIETFYLNEEIENVSSIGINSQENALYKGYIYTKLEPTTFHEVVTQEIDYAPIIDKIVIETKQNTYQTEKQEEKKANTVYKNTQISKENFEKILGQEGFIDIYNEQEEKIGTINKDTILEENILGISFEEDIQELKIATSKPIEEGKLEISSKKEIVKENNYKKEEIQEFQDLQMKAKNTYYYKDLPIHEENIASSVSLQEPYTEAEVYLDKTELSTVVTNQDITMNVILNSNKNEYDLYKNPTIEIVFPEYIKQINIKACQLVLEEELQIEEIKIEETEDAKQSIKIRLAGEQTKYNQNDVTKGAVIVLKMDITTDKLTPSKEDIIQTYVTNENYTTYQEEQKEKGYKETKINYIAPTGMVTVNEITHEEQTAISLSNQAESMQVEAYDNAKQVTAKMKMINNTDITATNIKILGRVPFVGNKDIITGEDLGSTFATNMIDKITAETGIEEDQMLVYYSENEIATKDIKDANNEWTMAPEDFSKVKSYLILLQNYEMKKGETIEFAYPMEIPAGLKQSEKTFGTYVMYYTPKVEEELKVSSRAEETENEVVAKATTVGIQTEEGPELEVSITSDVTKENVQEGQTITYTVTVKNVGKMEANNVTIIGIVPENATYIYKNPINDSYIENEIKKSVEETVEKIAVGESYEITYQVKVNKLEEGSSGGILEAYAKVSCDNLDKDIQSDSLYHSQIINILDIELSSNLYKTVNAIKENKELTFTLTLTNSSLIVKKVIPSITLPEGVTLVEAENTNYDETSRVLSWGEMEIAGQQTQNLTFIVKTEELGTEELEKNISFLAEVNVKYTQSEEDDNGNEVQEEIENTVYSSTLNYVIAKSSVNISLESDIEENEEIKSGDTLIYTIKIENQGKLEENAIYIKENIPRELEIIDIKAEDGVVCGQVNNSIDISLQMAGNTTKEVTIKTKVKEITEKRKEITNQLTYSIYEEIKQSNSIKHIIINENGKDPEETTYKISGTVWLDEDKDGVKDSSETKLRDIRVLLIDGNTGNLAKETTTNVSGKYTFENLVKNTYIVVFVYDNSEYSITEYQKQGVEEKENSDGIEASINLEGAIMTAAITKNLSIEDSNLYNIDLGLVERPEFDLKIEKLITSVTVQNSKGVKKQDYGQGTTYAKVDINPNYIKGTNIVVEYKIRVTNEGEVEGYAKSIVDYLPEELKFNSELNSNWYQNQYGTIYSLGLADTVIQPQETKEITLILTKTLTEETEMGSIKNATEIYQDYNIYGIKDRDSTIANKNIQEDDYAIAELVLSVNTGRNVLYIGLIMLSILLLGGGIYIIQKKVVIQKKRGEK